MKHVLLKTQGGLCLFLVVLMAGTAWADLMGAANVRQISFGRTSNDPGATVTFLTTDRITFDAKYYDPNPACEGVAPTFVQLVLFTQEGKVIQQFPADSNALTGEFAKFRTLSTGGSVGAFVPGPGSYKWTFLVRDCTSTKSVVLPGLLPFQVFAP